MVTTAADGIAQVTGMPSVMANELLEFPGGVIGVAQNLDTDSVGVVVLGNYESLKEGDEVKHRRGPFHSGWGEVPRPRYQPTGSGHRRLGQH